jgi:prepilin-type N-terminal cleavage/methylation domain-containing protein
MRWQRVTLTTTSRIRRGYAATSARTARAKKESERGDTLIEVLITLVVVGLVAASVLTAFATSISASARHRALATMDTVMRSAAELVTSQLQQQQNPLYVSCATPSTYNSLLTWTLPPGYQASVTNVTYWNALTFTSSCPAGSATPQKLTLQVTNAGVTASINVTIDDRNIVGTPRSQLAPPTALTATPSTTTSGAITATFNAPSNAPTGQTYTAQACTNTAMTTNCVTRSSFSSGSQVTGLTAAGAYYLTVTADAQTGYAAATTTSAGPVLATTQLNPPTITSTTTGSTTLTIFFNAPSNAPTPQTYAAQVCTNSAMTSGCTTVPNFTSGSQVTGLTSGTTYYATVTAGASSGYLAATSTVTTTTTTTKLLAPTGVTLSYGTTAGSLVVSFSPSSNAPSGQLYQVLLCTSSNMSTGCASPAAVVSPASLTGLYQGQTYYATITATASSGYQAMTSAISNGTGPTTQMFAPSGLVAAAGSPGGSLAVTFSPPSNASPSQLYSATACMNPAMTSSCITASPFTSGAQMGGLAPSAAYYVTVTAAPSSGYLAATSSVAGPTTSSAPIQLLAPTGVTLGYGTLAGSLTVTFSPSSNAPSGQAYTAVLCTNAAMTAGCLAPVSITSGAQVTGLTPGQLYYATVTASASMDYLYATSSASTGLSATTQLATPTSVVVAAGTSTSSGSLTVSFSPASNAPSGQTYTVTACTDTAMTQGCVTTPNFITGSQVTGLTHATTYYVTVTAGASPGYLAATTTYTGPTTATQYILAPSSITVTAKPGHKLQVTFTQLGSVVPTSYTLTYCTNSAMTTGCVAATGFTSGSQSPNTGSGSWYVTITAVAPAGYLSNTSAAAGPTSD